MLIRYPLRVTVNNKRIVSKCKKSEKKYAYLQKQWHYEELQRENTLKAFAPKGLVTTANGYVPEGKRTKICRIWLSGDKIYLLCRSKFSRSVCGACKLSNDRTSTGHVTGKTHDNRMCTG